MDSIKNIFGALATATLVLFGFILMASIYIAPIFLITWAALGFNPRKRDSAFNFAVVFGLVLLFTIFYESSQGYSGHLHESSLWQITEAYYSMPISWLLFGLGFTGLLYPHQTA